MGRRGQEEEGEEKERSKRKRRKGHGRVQKRERRRGRKRRTKRRKRRLSQRDRHQGVVPLKNLDHGPQRSREDLYQGRRGATETPRVWTVCRLGTPGARGVVRSDTTDQQRDEVFCPSLLSVSVSVHTSARRTPSDIKRSRET